MKKNLFAMVLLFSALLGFDVWAAGFQPVKTETAPLDVQNVPAQLKGWEAWATDGFKANNCVFAYNGAGERSCYFIPSLAIEVNGKEMSFVEKVALKDKGYVLVPGSFETFPYAVAVNGKPAPVANLLGLPYVMLEAGEYTLSGKAKAKEDIRFFSIPTEAAVLSVKKDGREVSNPAVDEAGILRLENISAAKKETDDISYNVFRKIDDTVPMMMTMRIELNVSGSQRVENLGKIIPENFAVLDINSDIPAYIQKNGELVAEAMAGKWWIEIQFRQIVESLSLKAEASPVDQEIWVFAKDTSRRALQVPDDLEQIQTSTTTLPDDWKMLPGFAVKNGQEFMLSTIEYQEKPKENLSLNRDIKLSFDGKFYAIRDNITANLKEDGQMSLNKPFNLSAAEINGAPQSIIIARDGNPGFEVRKGQANLTVINRIDRHVGKINAAGYDREFDNANWNLTLSPGYKLFHVSNADSVSSSWVANWNLLSIFMVVVLGVIFYYLFGLKKALAAFAAFVLLEPVMPSFILMSFILCGVIGVQRFIGKDNKASGVISLIKYSLLGFLGLATLGFMISNIRYAMYPGLNPGYVDNPLGMLISFRFLAAFYFCVLVGYWIYRICANPKRDTVVKVFLSIAVLVLTFVFGSVVSFVLGFAYNYLPMPMMAAGRNQAIYAQPSMAMEEAYYDDENSMDFVAAPRKMVSKTKELASQQLAQGYINNDAKLARYQSVNIARNRIQTGVGFPEWNDYNNINISIKGPVSREDAFGIYLLTPFMNLLMALAQLALGALALYYLVDRKKAMIEVPKKSRTVSKAVKILPLLCLLMIKPAMASEIPDDELLQELRTKLTREVKPACLPNCAAIPNAVVLTEGNDIVLDILMHAQDNVTAPLPSIRADGSGFMKITEVTVNGRNEAWVVRQNGTLNVMLNKGINNIRIKARPLEGAESFTIASDIKISLLQNASDRLEVSENAGDSQIFQVKMKHTAAAVRAGSEFEGASKIDIMPFFEVQRKLELGNIWQVTTTISRLNRLTDSASIEIPLLNGEKVISSEGSLKQDSIRISFEPNVASKEFISILPVEQAIALKAQPKMLNYREIWLLNVDLAWSFETKGLKAINANGLETAFVPSAGDSLEINAYRSKSFEGEVLTFDRADYVLSFGRSKAALNLNLKARSSEGGNHEIALPEGLAVKTLSIDGQNYPISQKGNLLLVPMNNGATNVALGAELAQAPGSIWRFPKIDLKAPVVNIYQSLNIAPDRWVLFASGPVKGPAVLFWSQIPILILLAWVFGRLKIGEVSGGAWFVLLLGLSQSRLWFSIVIIAWFMVMTMRERYSAKLVMKKLVQMFIPALTLLFLYCLIRGVSNGLLGTWDMKITGNGSYFEWANGGAWVLKWYQDAVDGLLPAPMVVSLPLWAYRTLMVAWSIWLSFSLVKWFKWGAKAYQKDGMWK